MENWSCKKLRRWWQIGYGLSRTTPTQVIFMSLPILSIRWCLSSSSCPNDPLPLDTTTSLQKVHITSWNPILHSQLHSVNCTALPNTHIYNWINWGTSHNTHISSIFFRKLDIFTSLWYFHLSDFKFVLYPFLWGISLPSRSIYVTKFQVTVFWELEPHTHFYFGQLSLKYKNPNLEGAM